VKRIRDVQFVPISPEKLSEGMEKLIAYMTNSPEQILIRTAMTHVEFEALHPFKDGNGRLGRMIITLMMWNAGVISAPHFYMSGYLEEHKDDYINALKSVSADGTWTEWCSFFLTVVEKQAIRNLKIAEDISKLYASMKVIFEEKLGTRWHQRALDFVFTNPYFRNNNFTNKSGIPTSTATKFTRTLVDNKLLMTLEEASGRKPALYAFEPLLKLVRV
jgi:Fic family protein